MRASRTEMPIRITTPKISVAEKNAAAARRIGGLNILLIVLIVVAGIFTIPCCIKKYEKNCSADTLQQTLFSEKNRGARLKIEYEIRTDYKLIEDYVTNQLSMKKEENYQVEYVMRETDNQSVVLDSEGKTTNILTGLARTLSAITEYFR